MANIVAVIGGGAAGLMASYQAAIRGAKVVLFERNSTLGRKILITGKGRCNLTNIKTLDEFVENIPGNGVFLYGALTRFSNLQLIDFFKQQGVSIKVERGGRVFPKSDKSQDIVLALKKAITKAKVTVVYNKRVKELICQKDRVCGIKFYDSNDCFYCNKVVIATGGCSYPATGSTGDGYSLAKQVGHTIEDIKPSLVPLITEENWVKELKGFSLKNVEATVYIDHKEIVSDFGEMLFTHFGISGPIILTLSRYVTDYLDSNNVEISIDLKPALTKSELDKRLLRDFEKYKRKLFKNALNDLLPKRLIPRFIHECSINPEKPVNQITKENRKEIINELKNFRLTICGCRENLAIVTKGGVSIKEIDPKTMESKLKKGLFFAGEVIDVDAYTGGYNLQIAFSTGYVAGISTTLK